MREGKALADWLGGGRLIVIDKNEGRQGEGKSADWLGGWRVVFDDKNEGMQGLGGLAWRLENNFH